MADESLPQHDVLPLPEDGYNSFQQWKKRIEAAAELVKTHKDRDWDRNLQSYKARTLPLVSSEGSEDRVVVPRDFSFVEQKGAQLFFQTPEVHLKAKLDQLADATIIFQRVLNHFLSEDEVDALAVMNEVGFDALCPSGIMVSKIGYEAFAPSEQVPLDSGGAYPGPPLGVAPGTGTLPPPVPSAEGMDGGNVLPFSAGAPGGMPGGPPPETGAVAPMGQSAPGAMPPPMEHEQPSATGGAPLPGQILGLGPTQPPPMAPPAPPMMVPNIVRERYFWERISPAAVLIPDTFSGSVYDKAPWLGYRMEECWPILKNRYHLTLDEPPKTKQQQDEIRIKSDDTALQPRASDEKVSYTEIWYRAAYFDPAISDPERFRVLVLLDGHNQPLVHKDSPYQTIDPRGKFVMGVKGNPIHIGALRYLSDSAFPPSEPTIGRVLNEELNKGRTQMVQQRDRNMPMRVVDLGRIGGNPGLMKLKANVNNGWIVLPSWDPNNPPFGRVDPTVYPRENFTFNEILDADMGELWAMGRNQRGQESDSSITATEISKIDEWATTRLDKERRQMLRYFVQGVRKLGALIQRFSTDTSFIEIVGPDQQKRMVPWNKQTIAGEFVYRINPDSSIRVDQSQQQQRVMKVYELLRKDPNVNANYLLEQIAEEWNMDPQQLINKQPPEKGPDPASVTIRLDPVALDVRNPNIPIYLAILREAGYKSLDQPDQSMGGLTPVQAALQYSAFQQAVVSHGMGGQLPPNGPPVIGGAPVPALEPPVATPAQGEHEGMAPRTSPISKHSADQTGNRSGPPPMGAPAGIQ